MSIASILGKSGQRAARSGRGFGAAGTPVAIVARLNTEVGKDGCVRTIIVRAPG